MEHTQGSGQRYLKLGLALLLLVLLIAAIIWLLRPAGQHGAVAGGSKPGFGSNLALDLRYSYDSQLFKPAAYDGAAEFPLRLDSADFSFYGKRIRGAGKLLVKEPGPVLYDFVGSQHAEVFEYWYKLEPQGAAQYDDIQLQGRLGLHQSMVYKRTAESRGWPPYFPDSLRGLLDSTGKRSGGSDTAYVEGWTLFGTEDLYFFYCIGSRQLSPKERDSVVAMINGLQFGALGAENGSAGDGKPETDDGKGAPGDKDKTGAKGDKSGAGKDSTRHEFNYVPKGQR